LIADSDEEGDLRWWGSDLEAYGGGMEGLLLGGL
jgi:hypothetical protein